MEGTTNTNTNTNNNRHPPQLNTNRTNKRGTRWCCCLFGILWKLLIFIIILVLLAILVSYIILQPRSFKVHVTHTNLTKFDYVHNTTNTNTLHYNLVLNFTIQNPNKKLRIYFDNFTMQALEGNHPTEAHAFYQGSRFDTTSLKAPWFSYLLGTKSSVPMSVVFSGKRVMVLDVGEFERDRSEGSFGIDLKIYFQIRFKIGDFIADGLIEKARANCGIKVPFSGSNATFEPTKCDVDF